MMVPMPTMESAVSVTSSVLLVWEVLLTVSHALPIKFSIKEAAGPPAPPSSWQALEQEALNVLITALMDSTKSQILSVLHAPSNAPLAPTVLTTVLHAFKDQSPQMEPAQLSAVRINSASKECALLVMFHATGAQSSPQTVRPVLQDM
jgi:hypothetical protein